MRLRHIEVFNAVMQTGSVSAAARLINITQPAVSRTLQHAELQLGFALFQRARGRLTPTNEALALFPRIVRHRIDVGHQNASTGSCLTDGHCISGLPLSNRQGRVDRLQDESSNLGVVPPARIFLGVGDATPTRCDE